MVTYVTTDPTGRWTGTGAPILPAQVDENFYEVRHAIDTIELQAPVSISTIEAQGTNMVITLSDNTQQTVAMPVPVYREMGEWQASTAYQAMDTVWNNLDVYFVNYAHTSQATFNPALTDGQGRYIYTKIISVPFPIPAGGAKGTFLVKTTADDYDIGWSNAVNLPVYGATNVFGAVTLNKNDGECQRLSITGNVTSLAISNFGISGQCSKIVLEIWNTGAFTFAFPAGTIWPGGVEPVVTSGAGSKDVFILLTMDGGTTIYGNIVGQNYG